jgi:hypothetical protein
MDTDTQKKQLASLFSRIKLIVLSPKECWDTISNEDENPQTILKTKVIPLLIVGALCTVVGYEIFGSAIGALVTWRPPLVSFTVSTIVMGVLEVVKLYIAAWLIQKLASFFQGNATPTRSFSFAAHAMLPVLAGQVLNIFPPLGLLGRVLLIITIYAFYQGVPRMTSVPQSQALGFTASFIVSMILISLFLVVLAGVIITPPAPGI